MPIDTSSRGVLLAVEGVDGSGKTVQVAKLVAALRAEPIARGREVITLREPGGTPLGESLRRTLLEDAVAVDDALVAALLFTASRRQLFVERVRPALRRGAIVVLDRSYLSTLVYQGVVGGVDLAFLADLQGRALDGVAIDAILLLDVDATTAASRRDARAGSVDAIEARGAAYLEAVVEGFRKLAAQEACVRLVDAHGSVGDVHDRCLDACRELVL